VETNINDFQDATVHYAKKSDLIAISVDFLDKIIKTEAQSN